MNRLRLSNDIYEIVADGAESQHDLAEGRLIPVVIIDAKDNQNIKDLIDFHENSAPGDVTSQWAIVPFKPNNLILVLKFTRPMEVNFDIAFNIPKHYSLIDGIIQSNGLHLQTGYVGDRVLSHICKPKITIEIPSLGFKEIWNKMLLAYLKKDYKKNGFSKHDAKRAALNEIKSMRSLWNLRKHDTNKNE